MISQQGRIVALVGDEAEVRIGGTSGCSVCDAGQGCGAGIFGRLLRKRPVSVRVRTGRQARVGQAVQIGISEPRYLALVFNLYAKPLIAGLIGASLGFAVATRLGTHGFVADMVTLAFAVASGYAGLNWSRRRLGEFPLGEAVHVMNATESAAGTECAAPGTSPPPMDDLKISQR